VILGVSYNRGAGLMVCLAAVKAGSKDCARGLASVHRHNVSLGVDPTSTYLMDGAGSDDNGKTTPLDAVTFFKSLAARRYGGAFRGALPILGRTGTLATLEPDSPAAGHVSLKDGTRAAGSPITGQTIMNTNTMAGCVDARSGRQLTIAIFVNNVPIESLAAAHAVADDQGAIAAAIQEAY
jgi:D-alanyl-D-alanine carboxypeptidase/D-alanyl-D-alanine-endopeptidase (penicillin-binding protein 4)